MFSVDDADKLRRATPDAPVRLELRTRSAAVADAIYDGGRADLNVADRRFEHALTTALEHPQTVRTGEFAADGGIFTPEATVLAPWEPETLIYVAEVVLPSFGVRMQVEAAPADALSPVGFARRRMRAFLDETLRDPAYEDEGFLFRDLWILEREAPEWLLDQLRADRGSRSRRQLVAMNMHDADLRIAALDATR